MTHTTVCVRISPRVVGLWAAIGFAHAASGDEAASARWPGPTALTVTYQATGFGDVYLGAGGQIKREQGIEIWVLGRPPRLNRELGIVHVVVDAVSASRPAQLTNGEFFALAEATVAKEALKAGGNAVVLTDVLKDKRGVTHFDYRVSAYLPESQRVEGPILFDATVRDADGNSVPNGAATSITVVRARAIGYDFVSLIPEHGIYGPGTNVSGNALAKICVGADGKVTEATLVKSSGSAQMDDVALSRARYSRYAPSKVRGRPVASCKYTRYIWKAY